jgi:hypothetical protein
MLKRFVLVVGSVFLLLGILGFVPGITITDADGQQLLLGFFMVGPFHNAFHLITGVAGLLAARSDRFARWYLRIFGFVYAALAILGFTVGIARVNTAGHVLHAVVAVVLLGASFALKPNTTSTTKFGKKEMVE